MSGGGNVDRTRLEYILDSINRWIQHSDSKAGFVMAGNSLIIAGLASSMRGLVIPFFDFGCASSVIFSLLLICAASGIVSSTCFAIAAVSPRLTIKQPTSNIYFGHIAAKQDRKQFVKSIATITPEDYCDDLANQIYVNALICWKKHTYVSTSFRLMASSVIFVVVCLGLLLGRTL
jgi:hypothetical protein